MLSPVVVSAFAPRAEIEAAQRLRRSHPLYASVCLQLLTEVINSRLFTTVCIPFQLKPWPSPSPTAQTSSCLMGIYSSMI